MDKMKNTMMRLDIDHRLQTQYHYKINNIHNNNHNNNHNNIH